MRGVVLLATLAVSAGVAAQVREQAPSGAAAAAPTLADQQGRLLAAKREGAAAAARAERLEADAEAERDAAARALAQERALGARVEAAAAGVAAGEARVAIVQRLLDRQRERLAAAQLPVARLLAALQSLARRPTVAAIAQPGSVDDLVHVRAVLGSAVPAVRRQTAGVRAALAATRALQARAGLAAQALRDGRAALERDRVLLARVEAAHRGRAQALGRGAMGEADRALALGERARDLVDAMAEGGAAEVTAAELAQLPGPVARPLAPGGAMPPPAAGAYRLPVSGTLVTGFGEISPAGVRSRGLSFAVRVGSPVVAPAGGVVRYARRFRGYGAIVIVDHGAEWTSLVTGLAAAAVAPGARVAMGAPIGRARAGDDPRVTVELRRRGRPVDIAALLE